MRIDGKAFPALLGACTLTLTVATVWLWPRLAAPGARPLTARISLLLGTQLSLAATFLITLNAWGGFYTSWGQLFGTASAKYTVTNEGPADPAKYDALSGEQFTGLRSGLTAHLQIYPPADHTDPFPVEVADLTGGAPGLSKSAYQHIADAYQVMVVVVFSPVGGCIPGVDIPGGPQGHLFWSQDLQVTLRAHYRLDPNPSAWAVAGVAQDGAAAMNLAVQDPSHYALAAAAGDWTHVPPQQTWPGLDRYLASVPEPHANLLYDPTPGNIPLKLRTSTGALHVTQRQGLTLLDALNWLGESLDAGARG
jgi:hypothetical protein